MKQPRAIDVQDKRKVLILNAPDVALLIEEIIDGGYNTLQVQRILLRDTDTPSSSVRRIAIMVIVCPC